MFLMSEVTLQYRSVNVGAWTAWSQNGETECARARSSASAVHSLMDSLEIAVLGLLVHPSPHTSSSAPKPPNPKPQIPNPKPSTLNSQPQTHTPQTPPPFLQPPNLKPETRTPRPETRNLRPETGTRDLKPETQNSQPYRGTSLIRNSHPPRTTVGP